MLFIENMKYVFFKAILKCKIHPSILQIRKSLGNSIFCFKEVAIEEISKEIHKLSSKKASQSGDIPTRII